MSGASPLPLPNHPTGYRYRVVGQGERAELTSKSLFWRLLNRTLSAKHPLKDRIHVFGVIGQVKFLADLLLVKG